jgi:hypothetical protein
LVPGVQTAGGETQDEGQETGPHSGGENLGPEEASREVAEGPRIQAEVVTDLEPQAPPEGTARCVELDGENVAAVQGGMGGRVRLLRENRGCVDARSLHPARKPGLSGNRTEQHRPGLRELQRPQARQRPVQVVQGSASTCRHCGLPTVYKGFRAWVNPPYGPRLGDWLRRGPEADVAVFLVPARTDTRWFHGLVLPAAAEVRFLRGRLKFGGAKTDAPFPSMVVVYRKVGAAGGRQ